MAISQYTIYFSDTSKTPFIVSPYGADGPLSPSNPLFIDRAVRASTTLKLYGKGTPNYGEGIEQNLIYMLENFAGPTAPLYSIEGQLWYNNTGGSPYTAGLRIKNGSGTWTSILMETGSYTLSGYLTLNADPVNPLHAATKQYVDALETAIQADLLTKVDLAGDTMDVGANLTFNGGEVLGLPNTPSDANSATSKYYVDSLITSGAGGDGVLSGTAWLPGAGTVGSVSDNIIELTVSYPGSPNSATFTIEGVSRVGHGHDADEITFDNSVLVTYPADIQQVVEFIDSIKAPISNPTFTGTVSIPGTLSGGDVSVTGTMTLGQNPTSSLEAATKQYVDSVVSGSGSSTSAAVSIDRELSLTVGGSPAQTIYQVPEYVADSNSLFIYIDGIKQYGHTYNGKQTLSFDPDIVSIDDLALTYLKTTINYIFNITVDGVGPTLITITAGSLVSTYGELTNTINSLLQSAGFDATFSIFDTATLLFKSNNSGASAAIEIGDPGGSPASNYLFNIPSAVSILRPEFVGDFTDPDPLNWNTPDTLIFTGDVTSSFPAGTVFTVSGSTTDYDTYDGVYSVYTTGPTYSGGSNETTVPIATPSDNTLPTPLVPNYSFSVGGSPAPSVPVTSTAGDVYLVYLQGLSSVNTATTGMDGDYREITYSGSPLVSAQAAPGTTTTWIEFNYDVPASSKMEVNVFN